MTTNPHRSWHSRGYLPHFDEAHLVQSITFRLYDSLPASVLAKLKLNHQAKPTAETRHQLEAYLDAGYGQCFLRDERIATLTQNALHHFDGKRYHLLAWVIMPNHVHCVIQIKPGYPLFWFSVKWTKRKKKERKLRVNRGGILLPKKLTLLAGQLKFMLALGKYNLLTLM